VAEHESLQFGDTHVSRESVIPTPEPLATAPFNVGRALMAPLADNYWIL
jgi:hypothetical protein